MVPSSEAQDKTAARSHPLGARRAGKADRVLRALAVASSGSLLLLLVLPLVAVLTYAPLGRLLQAASDPGVEAALGFTLLASGIALGISLLTGVPLGYLLARRRFRGKSVLEAVVVLPIVLPHLVAGLALLFLFAPTSPVGALAIRAGFPVFGTIWGAVLVMVYVGVSYTVLASQVAFRAVDGELLEVSRSLGATPRDAFATVTLPLALRGIASGAVLSWARSVSEIGGFLIIAYTVYPSPPYAGPVTSPISVYVYNLYQIGDLPGAAAVASLLVLIAFALFLAVRLVERSRFQPGLREAMA